MSSDRTQHQSRDELSRARSLSLERSQPPTDVPGYELKNYLGAGAFGEVWSGVDLNTGRRVAVKFYLHRGGVDWSLLSREVEKLVFLSADRYVVQLLDVGWDADPPYYVMEYVEDGSLEDLLQTNGPLPISDAVQMFREIAIGLVHAHGKGVLHCDLKPANVLLDQDRRPRLADFGQSRLSHEQTPALGTLFFMAPEQADLEAVPDARWDVYALGAIFVCLLTGQPPHRNETSVEHIDTARDLVERLQRYRQLIANSPPVTDHLRVSGMDRALSEIIERCLAVEPERRFANVQEILEALRIRELHRTRRPLLLLGIIVPLLLLATMGLMGWRGYTRALRTSEEAVAEKIALSNRFAAHAVASAAAGQIEEYFQEVEDLAAEYDFQEEVREILDDPALAELLGELSDPATSSELTPERRRFIDHPARQPLQRRIDRLLATQNQSFVASWFVCDDQGTQIAASFRNAESSSTVGRNYSWRTYFHGGPLDLVKREPADGRTNGGKIVQYLPRNDQHLKETQLSAPFQSTATNLWKVAISTPIYEGDRFLGVVAMTVNLGGFVNFPFDQKEQQFATLVDGRPGNHTGMILQHPLFDQLLAKQGRLPKEFTSKAFRVDIERLGGATAREYVDPLGKYELGQAFDKTWVAAPSAVRLLRRPGRRGGIDTGLVVLVQEDLGRAMEPVRDLGSRLAGEGLAALVGLVSVVFIVWFFVLRSLGQTGGSTVAVQNPPTDDPTPIQDRATLAAHSGTRRKPPAD